MSDFIKGFPNAASKEYCDKVINRFDYLQETQSMWGDGRGKIWTRQDAEGVPATQKEDDAYYLGGTEREYLPIEEKDKLMLNSDMSLLREFTTINWSCYKKYSEKYGILGDISRHQISSVVKIQKTEPSQGYHIWHCDSSDVMSSRKIMVVILYLNTVEEGGETEFLYQSKRIPPIQGTLALFPATWTHTHRGNPPLKGNKYILTTWLELVE
jgi:hypothetical protein